VPEQVVRAVQHAPIFANQVEYHPLLGQDELLALARKHDFTLTAYSPLARGDVFQDDPLARIAERHDASPAEVSLAWLVSQDKVTAIPKATSTDHIESNLRALDIELSDDEIREISGLERGERLVDPPFAPW
jgi:2,5-diketo-D-gluconate reductase B